MQVQTTWLSQYWLGDSCQNQIGIYVSLSKMILNYFLNNYLNNYKYFNNNA